MLENKYAPESVKATTKPTFPKTAFGKIKIIIYYLLKEKDIEK